MALKLQAKTLIETLVAMVIISSVLVVFSMVYLQMQRQVSINQYVEAKQVFYHWREKMNNENTMYNAFNRQWEIEVSVLEPQVKEVNVYQLHGDDRVWMLHKWVYEE